MMMALMDGTALPAGQLAIIGNVAPQTASSHLSKLVQGRLLIAEHQGRHRYYRLASREVAYAIEALLSVSPRPVSESPTRRPPDDPLAHARTCYSHLAGRLAVKIADALVQRGVLVRRASREFAITNPGQEWFAALGIELSDRQLKQPGFARSCLDWTERRDHIAGKLGSMMLSRFRELKWFAPMRNTRALRVTLEGEQKLNGFLKHV